MMEIKYEQPPIYKMAKEVADKAMDEFEIDGKTLRQWIKEVEEYYIKKEQGKIVELPCKLGDVLYETQFVNRKWEIFPFKVNYFEVMKSHGKTRVEIHFEGTEGYALCDENGNLDEEWYFSEQEARGALEGMKDE